MSDEKPTLRIYISFLNKDGERAVSCADLLERTIKVGLKDRYQVKIFRPDRVLTGEVTDETLEDRIGEADLAIVLVSYEYLDEGIEAQRVQDMHKHPIIVRLVHILPDASISPFHWADFINVQPYVAAKDENERQSTANHVANFVGRILTERETASRRAEPRLTPEEIAEELSNHVELELAAEAIPARANRGIIEHREDQDIPNENTLELSADITDAVLHLIAWANGKVDEGSRLCALLGDLGTGKTTSAILLTRRLLALRKTAETAPLPIYFDLSDLSPKGLTDFGLHTILEHLVAGSSKSTITVADLCNVIRSESTLIIFDGLDEILIHLSRADGHRLTRSLIEALTLGEQCSTRVLLSCRTQYFRAYKEEVSYFEEKGRRHSARGVILTLLSFNEQQILEYFRRNIPKSNPSSLLKLIRSVHDLHALAAQPVILNMIRQEIPRIEEDLDVGRRVHSVDLYGRFINQWLNRDDGKHRLIPEHKIQLMTHLAWQVWNSGSRTWSARWMETWMLQFLHAHPEMELDYKERMPDQWKQDFRTATFLARRGDDFAFAHSSLLEYFLAKRLTDSLVADSEDEAPAVWDIVQPSDNTYMFLGELIDRLPTADRRWAFTHLEHIGKHGTPDARTNVFAYTLQALERGYPHPRPRALNLSDTDLRDWKIGSKQTHVDLSGVPLTGARLDYAHIQHTRLDRADAAGASMQRALFEHCSLTNTDLTDADLTGTIFRHCNLEEAPLDKARRHRTQLLHTSGTPQQLSDVLIAPLTRHGLLRILPEIQILGGQSDDVTAVAWSPDGAQLLTVSRDGTVRVWDATTGENTLTLTHTESVTAVAWSPDSTHILTAGIDRHIRIWNLSRKTNIALIHPFGWFRYIEWSPDSTQVLAGTEEGTVGIWSTDNDHYTIKFEHDCYLQAALWSPDSKHILTGSGKSVHIWNTATGTIVLTLNHSSWVRSVAWSPDSKHIAVGLEQNATCVFTAATGATVLTLNHSSWVRSVAWSPDGSQIVTQTNSDICVWDMRTGKKTHTFAHNGNLIMAEWSPDSTHLLMKLKHNTHIWSSITGNTTLTLTHTGRINSATWSPDGDHILTASDDGTARIWNAATGEPVRFFITALPGGECAVLTPDQTRVIGASPYAWRWLGRYAIHPDGTRERIPVEIDGPLPPLGPGTPTE